ncbi:MAG TPA: serine hydrolase [Gemmatimonadales bacterium]|nr:serine hydrolase [Gemmatimonadales bacterium]
MFRRVLVSILLGVAPAVHAQAAPSRQNISRELDRFIQQGMRDWEIPGLSVAVVSGDSVVFSRGYGVRQLGQPGAVDANTLFGIMSTTKAFTAMLIAMLVDDGTLHWNDPVTKWVPEFQMPDPYVTRALTVKDLLTHSTGLGNADMLWARGDLTEAEIFRRVRLLAPAYGFRDGFIYQNVMYGLAGEVIARATGKPFPEVLRERIFAPLGMTRSFPTYASMAAANDANTSRAHFRIRDTIRVIEEDKVDLLAAAGSSWSTANDMSRWLRFLLDSARVNGRRLVSDSSFRMLFTPQVMVSPDEFYPTQQLTRPHWRTYGLGWFQQDYRGEAVSFHTGSLDGRTAIIGLIPDRRLGVYVFGNLDHAEFRHALMLKTFDLYLGGQGRDWNVDLKRLYDGLRREGDSAEVQFERTRISHTQPTLPLAAYAGTFSNPLWGDVVVELRGDTLHARMGSSAELAGPLEHWNYDSFRARLGDGRSSPARMQFRIGTAGGVTELVVPFLDGAVFARQVP